MRDWLVHTAKPRLRHSTYVSYEVIVRKHLIPALGKIRLRQLTSQRVQALLNQKRQAGLSPRRVQFIRAVLRAALTDAEKWGMVRRNVAALVDPPRQERQRKNPLSPEEAQQVLDAVRGHRLAPLFTFILAAGVRPGEALALRWEDLDEERREVRIRHGLHWMKGEPVLLPPKNERSVRTIPLADEALRALKAHRVRQLEDKLRAGQAWEETDFVFTTRIGRPLMVTNVYHTFNGLLRKAGLPGMRLYDLRHACASFLLAMGVDLKRISEILGHADISTTANVYAHVMPAMMRDAADKMDALLRSLRRPG